jgi:hypothetical protein
MGASKSQGGPSRAVLIASAVVLIVVLVGAAYWTNSRRQRPTGPSLAASTLQPILDRCEEAPVQEQKEGFVQTRCTSRVHPAFAFSMDTSDGALRRAALMVPLMGTEERVAERRGFGLEFFGLIAGGPVETLFPSDQLDAIGTEHTEITIDGVKYVTDPTAFGLAFVVTPE